MSHFSGIVLFGPPASGKDTITRELTALDPSLRLFCKLKHGAGRTAGYRPASAEAVAELHAGGLVVSEVARYGNRYIIDRPEVERMAAEGFVPVVHTAEEAELSTLVRMGWAGVLLWSSRRETLRRLKSRGDANAPIRLDLWDRLACSLRPLSTHLRAVVRTDEIGPSEAARAIVAAIAGPRKRIDLGALAAVEPVAAAGVIIAAPTLSNDSGGVDWKANEAYASAAATGNAIILVAGSTGRGDEMIPNDRAKLQRLWTHAVGKDRVVCCLWGYEDVVAALEDGRAGLGLASLVSGGTATWELAASRPGLVAYSHPRLGWQLRWPFDSDADSTSTLPAGAKLSKTGTGQLAAMRRSFPARFAIWHGSARRVAPSLAAGADAVVASAAAPLACGVLPGRTAIQADIDQIQRQMDTQETRGERLQLLEELVRRRLAKTG